MKCELVVFYCLQHAEQRETLQFLFNCKITMFWPWRRLTSWPMNNCFLNPSLPTWPIENRAENFENYYTFNSTVNFRNQRLGCHLVADYTIIMSRTLKVTGNHVMYDRGAWFLTEILSSSRALCCLPSVKKQKHDFQVCFVDRPRNRKSNWRQGLTDTKKSTKVVKELFAD